MRGGGKMVDRAKKGHRKKSKRELVAQQRKPIGTTRIRVSARTHLVTARKKGLNNGGVRTRASIQRIGGKKERIKVEIFENRA